jgi:hypothetical protein
MWRVNSEESDCRFFMQKYSKVRIGHFEGCEILLKL